MTKAEGYARVYRGVLDHPAFRNWAEASAFIWLIVRAAWKPTTVRFLDKSHRLERGELAISVRQMATGFGWSRASTRRFIDRLQADGMLQARVDGGVTVLRICNYSTYQAASDGGIKPTKNRPTFGPPSGPPILEGETESTGPPSGQQPAHPRPTEQRIKESNNNNSTLKRAQTIPEDWSTPPLAELSPQAKACATQWPVGQYDRQAEAFANYWTGVGKPMKNWKATWANWVVRVHPAIMRDAERQAPRPDAAKSYLQLVQEGKA